jgi:hypothetical protein
MVVSIFKCKEYLCSVLYLHFKFILNPRLKMALELVPYNNAMRLGGLRILFLLSIYLQMCRARVRAYLLDSRQRD